MSCRDSGINQTDMSYRTPHSHKPHTTRFSGENGRGVEIKSVCRRREVRRVRKFKDQKSVNLEKKGEIGTLEGKAIHG